MSRTPIGLVVLTLLCACAQRAPEEAAAPGARAPIGLQGASPSVDALLDRFVDALSRKDEAGLHGLRVSEEEYTRIIIPGTIEKGQPPNQTFEKTNRYFWGMLNTKSIYFAQALLRDHGGRTYVARAYEFTEPAREYAWYSASGQLRMTLTDAQGGTHNLRSGWIAEVDGQYKFLGFEWDD